MKKELLFSFIGHFIIFAVIIGSTIQKRPKEKAYPDVFQVSVVSLNMGSGSFGPGGPGTPGGPTGNGTAPNGVSFLNKKPSVTKSKTQLNTKTGTGPTQSATQAQMYGFPGGGIGIQGLGVYSKGGRYSYYVEMILKKIGANWTNPYEGSSKKFAATIYFVVHKNGKITSVKIEKGSGNELFDRSAERAVTVTNYLPPLAGEFENQDSLKLHLEFEYKR
jgi:TonB family protein